ncbi:MAG: aminotransferase class V-fold PLP-dependent enzyme [Chitinispirillaceae bacterium]
MPPSDPFRQFPILKSEKIYLNHAGTGPLPAPSARAMKRAIDDLSRTGPDFETWVRSVELSRKNIATLMGGRPEGIGFLQNTAQAISTIAYGLDWNDGDEIIIPTVEYPANQYPWISLKRFGVTVINIDPQPDGTISLDSIEKAFTPRTRLVAISHVQYGNGFRIDLTALSSLCHSHNIHLLVDIIQSLGALPVDVDASGVDFAAAGAHKWLLSPPGIGVLYVKPELMELIQPTMVGALSVTDPLNFDNINFELPPNGRRFECGTANFPGFAAMEKSTHILSEMGIEAVSQGIKFISDYLCDALKDAGYRILSSRHDNSWSGIVSFTKPELDIRHMAQELMKRGIMLTVRRGALRCSPHFYTTSENVDRFIHIIGEVERSL